MNKVYYLMAYFVIHYKNLLKSYFCPIFSQKISYCCPIFRKKCPIILFFLTCPITWWPELHILLIYVNMPLVYAHEILSQCDMYFLNGSHFSKFLYVALLSTWLNVQPLYLTQLCINSGATHRKEIMHLSIIFLKLNFTFTFCTF